MKLTFFRKMLVLSAVGLPALAPVTAQEVVAPPALPAATAADLLPSLTTPQFVRLSPNGSLVGTISRSARDGALRSIPNLEVSLITSGKIIARVISNPDGDFSFGQVKPGYYTIVASNPKDLLVFPLTVGENDGQEVEPTLMVAATPISPSRREAMLAAVLGVPNTSMPSPLYPVVPSRVVEDTFSVRLNSGGELTGRLGVLGTPSNRVNLSGMVVRVMREDSVMGEATVSADGRFVVAGVSPGPVSFFAFGPQGFLAIGLKLVGGGGISGVLPADAETFVAMQSADLNVEIAPISDVIAGVSIPGDSFSGPSFDPLGMNSGGFGGPGGSSSGGGGGGGGSGAEGLLGLGAAALAAAALGDSGGDGGFIPAPTSPAQIQ